ncbi:hypothetical protein HY837_00920 [archaeon]|nr:hypothetical protein [archaeon]
MLMHLFKKIIGKPYIYSQAQGINNHTYCIKDENVDYTLSVTEEKGTIYHVLNERYLKERGLYYNLSGQVGTIENSGIVELLESDEDRVNQAKFEHLHEKLKEFKKLIKK